jgi:hypothetical protein
MELLITLIGDAAVDPNFREELLQDPLAAADAWGFRLTKGEVDLLLTMFTGDQRYLAELESKFKMLEDQLYLKLPCGRPCNMSAYPPPGPRRDRLKNAA